MPRRLFKRYMPDPEQIKKQKYLRFLGRFIHRPNLWQLNRHSVSRAMAVGLFAALIPVPMQMLLAAAMAIFVRANIPISIGLVWLTNPLTTPPIFYITYKIGALIMQIPPRSLPDKLTFEWIQNQLSSLWQPFLLGSLVLGVVLAVLGYFLTIVYWRWRVKRSWDKRKLAHQNMQDQTRP